VSFELLPRACPVCNATDGSALFAEANVDLGSIGGFAFASRKLPEYMHWRLMECRVCDVLYSSPAPPVETLARLYRDAEFASSTEAGMASRTYGRLLRRLLTSLPDRSAAGDVGAGDGSFLRELLQAGFTNVVGIEPSAAPIAAADEQVRPLLRQGIFRSDSFAGDSLSLVTCFQTIEHLSDPLSFCRDAWRALKPGGALLLVGHNRRAFSTRLLGRKSPIFDIEHMQLFSPKSASTLLQRAGFRDVEVRTVYNRYPIRYWAQLFPFPRSLKVPLLRGLQSSGLGRLEVCLPAGNIAMYGFKPPNR
jgi:SAM-dependent methyltransferase